MTSWPPFLCWRRLEHARVCSRNTYASWVDNAREQADCSLRILEDVSSAILRELNALKSLHAALHSGCVLPFSPFGCYLMVIMTSEW